MTSRRSAHIIFFAASIALVLLLHFTLLELPFHWDEAGQFIPTALDLYRDGAWVAHSTDPNIHPPGLAMILAAVWRVTGFSILATRLTMLAIAGVGVYLSFLLAIRLARVSWGTPAFPAILFLVAAPLFQAQSMLVLLDLPVMTFTVLALLLFLNERYAACAAVCVVLVLLKETAISTPMVFAAWLWFRDRRRREAFYFVAPAFALALWLVVLHQATGSWFGNSAFASYNLTSTLTPWHLIYAIIRRAYFLLFADGHWIGAIALYFGWRILRGRDWEIAAAVAWTQLIVVTFFGGAVLERYLLPILPVFYAAVAIAATLYSRRIRIASHGAMLLLLVAGWFWDSPFPAPLENNLSMVDFVHLQETGAQYLELYAGNARVAATWPFNNAIAQPDLGYVRKPLSVIRVERQEAADFAKLDPSKVDAAVTYSRGVHTPQRLLNALPSFLRNVIAGYVTVPDPATPEEMERLGFAPMARWSLGGEWIQIYGRGRPSSIAGR